MMLYGAIKYEQRNRHHDFPFIRVYKYKTILSYFIISQHIKSSHMFEVMKLAVVKGSKIRLIFSISSSNIPKLALLSRYIDNNAASNLLCTKIPSSIQVMEYSLLPNPNFSTCKIAQTNKKYQ